MQEANVNINYLKQYIKAIQDRLSQQQLLSGDQHLFDVIQNVNDSLSDIRQSINKDLIDAQPKREYGRIAAAISELLERFSDTLNNRDIVWDVSSDVLTSLNDIIAKASNEALYDKLVSSLSSFTFDKLSTYSPKGKINVTAHPRTNKSFDLEGLVRELKRYNFEQTIPQRPPEVYVDNDILGRYVIIERDVEDINAAITALKQRAVLTPESPTFSDSYVSDYLESLQLLANNAQKAIKAFKKNDKELVDSDISIAVAHVSKQLSDILADIKAVNKNVNDDWESLPQQTKDALLKIGQDIASILNVSAMRLNDTNKAIADVVSNDKIKRDLEIRFKQIQRKFKEPSGNWRRFTSPIEEEISRNLQPLLQERDLKLMKHLQQMRLDTSYKSDYLRGMLLRSNSESFYQKNQSLQRTFIQSEKAFKSQINVFNKVNDNPVLANKTLSNIGNILTTVAEQQLQTLNVLNLPSSLFVGVSKNDKDLITLYQESLTSTIQKYEWLIMAMQSAKTDNAIIKQIKAKHKELVNTKERLELIKTSSVSFTAILSDVFNTTFALLNTTNQLSRVIFSGQHSLFDLINPLKAIANAIQAMNMQGQLRSAISRTDAAHGLGVDRAANDMLSYSSPKYLYDLSYGKIDFPTLANTYTMIFNIVGGSALNTPEQNRQDMRYLAQNLVLDKEILGLDDSSIANFAKVFYRDVGLSADETAKQFRDLELTAIQSNIPVHTFVSVVTRLATSFRSVGISEVRAYSIMKALMKSQALLIEDAESLAASTAKAAAGWSTTNPNNWAKNALFGMLTGDDSLQSSLKDALISVDRYGKVNDRYYDTVIDRMFAQVTMFDGLDKPIGLFKLGEQLKQNGYSPKDISIIMSMAQEGRIDELKEKLKSINLAQGESTAEATNKFASAIRTSAEQLSEVQKIESTYQSYIYTLAYNLHNMFGDSIRNFVNWIDHEVALFIRKFSEIWQSFGNSEIAKQLLSFTSNHPILAPILAYSGYRLARVGGGKLLSALMALPTRLFTNKPISSAERGVVSNIIHGLEGLSPKTRALLISAIMAGTATLADVLYQYSARTNEDDKKELQTFLKSGDAKAQVNISQNEEEWDWKTLLGIGTTALLSIAALRRGKAPSNSRGLTNLLSRLFNRTPRPPSGLTRSPRMSSAERRRLYTQRRELGDVMPPQSPGFFANTRSIILNNLGWSIGLNTLDHITSGQKLSLTDIAQDTALLSAGELFGAALFGRIGGVVTRAMNPQNATRFVERARNIGGITGIFGVNYLANASYAEAASIREVVDEPDSLINTYVDTPSQSPMPQSPQIRYMPVVVGREESSLNAKRIKDEDAKEIVERHTGLRNRRSEVDAGKKATTEQSKAFSDAAKQWGLSNQQFIKKINQYLSKHGLTWQQLNTDQKEHWLKKYHVYLEVFNNRQQAIMAAAAVMSSGANYRGGYMGDIAAGSFSIRAKRTFDVNKIQAAFNARGHQNWDAKLVVRIAQEYNLDPVFFAAALILEGGSDLNPGNVENYASGSRFGDFSSVEQGLRMSAKTWSKIAELDGDDVKIATAVYAPPSEGENSQYVPNVSAIMAEILGESPVTHGGRPTSPGGVATTPTIPSGSIPHYKQWEYSSPAWDTYAEGYGYTMKNTGCAPSALAIQATQIMGKQITPTDVANWATSHGMTRGSASLITSGAQGFGYQVQAIMRANSQNGQAAYEAIKRGIPVILGVDTRLGAHSDYGHYVVAQGIDTSGHVIFNDPGLNDAYGGYAGRYTWAEIIATNPDLYIPVTSSTAPSSPPPAPAAAPPPVTTPPSQTHQSAINVPIWNQADAKWGGMSHGLGDMASSGCYVTSAAMLRALYTGEIIDPGEFLRKGYWAGGSGAKWVQDLQSKQVNPASKEEALRLLRENLKKGKPIMGYHSGYDKVHPRSSVGHAVVYVGYDNEGKVIVWDPNGGVEMHLTEDELLQNAGVAGGTQGFIYQVGFEIPDINPQSPISYSGGGPTLSGSSANTLAMTPITPPKPRTTQEILSDTQSRMKKISEGKVISGGLISDLYVDPNQKYISAKERRVKAEEALSHDRVGQFASQELKSELQAKMDREQEKIDEVKETLKLHPDFLPKRHFKEALKIIRALAEKYLTNIEIKADCPIN